MKDFKDSRIVGTCDRCGKYNWTCDCEPVDLIRELLIIILICIVFGFFTFYLGDPRNG